MVYGGEILHGNKPEDWEALSILRSDRLGLYGDGLVSIYEHNLINCEQDEAKARDLYAVLYANDETQIQACGKMAYNKAIRIKRNLSC